MGPDRFVKPSFFPISCRIQQFRLAIGGCSGVSIGVSRRPRCGIIRGRPGDHEKLRWTSPDGLPFSGDPRAGLSFQMGSNRRD